MSWWKGMVDLVKDTKYSLDHENTCSCHSPMWPVLLSAARWRSGGRLLAPPGESSTKLGDT